MALLKRGESDRSFFTGKNKKGELTTKQLVVIIVLIASFIIILFLFFRLNLGEASNKEICRNSVLLQEKSALFSGPLDCRTNYMCVSGGGTCEEITPTATERVDPNSEKEIMEVLAEEMSDCWWMFGEGEVDYVGRDLTGRASCSICSIVEFDENLQREEPISYEEFYDYLKTTTKTNSQTYLQYLYSTNSPDDLEEGFGSSMEGYLENNLDFSKDYFILTGRTNQGHVDAFLWNWKFWETETKPYPVVMMEVSQENYEKIGCDEFLTKA